MTLTKKTYSYADMLMLSFKTSPLYSCIWLVHNIVSALLPTLAIFVTARFINSAIAVYNQEAEMQAVYLSVALLLTIMGYNYLSGIALNLLGSKRQIFYRRKLIPEMIQHRANLHYRHVKNPASRNLIRRIYGPFEWDDEGPFDHVVWTMYSRMLEMMNLIIFVAGIVVTLTGQVWWFGPVVLLSSVPLLYISARGGKKNYDAGRDVSYMERRSSHLSWLIRERAVFEERYVFNTTPHLNKQYWENWERSRKHKLRVFLKNHIKSKVGGIFVTVYATGSTLALIPLVTSGSISMGMFIALVGAVFGLANRLSGGVSQIVINITKLREYLKDLTQFMQLEQQPDATALPKKNMTFKTIEFNNVSFKYPDTDKPILSHCSFRIENGKHYAFVGINGAGKTTITKLITGLYDNYEGEILVDGKSLREFSQAEIKGLSSVVYQDFAQYSISLYDNIAIANPHAEDCRESVTEILEYVGLSNAVANLKDGIETPLGKVLEGGVDLSGGEWQRVAMARNVLNPAPLKILDEPTAALDPISESTVYRNYEQISKGKTTIFISHRLGSCKLADIIFVVDGGKIVESGSHTQLTDANGLYAEMYKAQAEWYNETEADVHA